MQRRTAVANGVGFVVAFWFFVSVFGGHVGWLGLKGLLLLAASWFAASTIVGRIYDRVAGNSAWPRFDLQPILSRLQAWRKRGEVAAEMEPPSSTLSSTSLAAIPATSFTISENFEGEDAGRRAAFPPAQREAYAIVMSSSLKHRVKWIYWGLYQRANFEKLAEMTRLVIVPQMQPHEREALLNAGGSSRFASGTELLDQLFLVTEGYRNPDAMVLGIAEPPIAEPEHPMIFQGEGHIATIATTGSGKGQRYILPTLMTYPGNVICLDPKGENYHHTGGARGLFGKVFRWAPFDRHGNSDSFNPLDAIEDADDARVLADLLVNPSDSGEKAFWESSARDVVRGLILYIKTLPKERRNIRELVRLLYGSDDDLDRLRNNMSASEDELVREVANQLQVMADKMFTSILQSARTELEAWRSEAIASCTSHTTRNWDLRRFVAAQRGTEKVAETEGSIHDIGYKVNIDGDEAVIERGAASSVFFVVPPDRIKSYASVLRVMLGMHLKALAVAEADFEMENRDMMPAYAIPSLLLFDELPQLGYMQIVEEQILVARAARIRMWLVAQNLSQLQKVYPNWESMIANCRVQVFFGTNDTTTAKEISERCGTRSNIFNEVQPLASVTEITGHRFANHAIVFTRGTNPVKLRLPPPFHSDPRMERIRKVLRQTGNDVPERERQHTADVAAERRPNGPDDSADETVPPAPAITDADADEKAPASRKRRPRPQAAPQTE